VTLIYPSATIRLITLTIVFITAIKRTDTRSPSR
jgi:hypothetical protein